MCFVAACAPCGARFSTAKILGPGKFLAAEIDHVVAGDARRDVRLQFRNLYLNCDCSEDQEGFKNIRRNHYPQGDQSERCFACQAAL
jgi:hypothetical protein